MLLFFGVVMGLIVLASLVVADLKAGGAIGVGVDEAAAIAARFAREASTAASDVGRPDLAMALIRLLTACLVAKRSASEIDDLLLPASREDEEIAWVAMVTGDRIRDTRYEITG